MSATTTQAGPSDRRFELFDQMLRLFPPGRLVDVGAGHGRFSLRAADAGWTADAVDARAARFPSDAGTVTWITEDVRKIDLSQYDVIACLGLFYHLTFDDQMALLRGAAGTPIILDTHVDNGLGSRDLSDRGAVGGYEGRWYSEPKGNRSSWGNRSSFWATPESLFQMLRDCGYPTVLAAEPWYEPDRTFFLALPEGYRPAERARRS